MLVLITRLIKFATPCNERRFDYKFHMTLPLGSRAATKVIVA